MVRYISAFLFIGIITHVVATAGNPTDWSGQYGTNASDGCYATCQANDGGFILAGYSRGSTEPDPKPDGFLIHIDANGQEIWRSFIDCDGWEYFRAITPLQDQTGYICTGFTISADSTRMDLLIAIISNEGVLLHIKTYGGTGDEMGNSVCPTTDGHYLILGATNSFGAGEDDYYYLKVDQAGDTLWTKTHGCVRSDVGNACLESGGYYYLAGSTGLYDIPNVSTGNNRDMYLVKTGTDGSVIDSASFFVMGGSQGEFDAAYSICIMQGGNICITGSCSKEGSEVMNVGIVVTDPDLNLQWKKNFEPGTFYDFGYAVCTMTSDSCLLLAGSLNYATDASTTGWIAKMDISGNLIWKVIPEATAKGALCSIACAGEDTYLVSGYCQTNDEGCYDMWSLTIRDLQVSSPGNPSTEQGNLFHLWPNPCHNHIEIGFTGQVPFMGSATLFSSGGQQIISSTLWFPAIGNHIAGLELPRLTSGWYILKISDGFIHEHISLFIN